LVVDAEKKENERKRKRKTLLGEKRSVRKSLTGPTLLEMSGRNLASLQKYRKLVLDVVESSSPAGILFD
jgi:hypothetical protein